MELLALLGGVSSLKPASSWAQTRIGIKDLESLTGVKAEAAMAKAIKVLLFPQRDVFQAEFGRVPLGMFSAFPGGEKCDFFFEGQTCSKQKCGNLADCDYNWCEDQKCSKLSGCEENYCPKQGMLTGESNIFSERELSQIMNDPFILALCRQLKVTTAQGLSYELRRLLVR